jgi:hypothetical protein
MSRQLRSHRDGDLPRKTDVAVGSSVNFQLPPMCGSRSNAVASSPSWRRFLSMASPAGPAPITAARVVVLVVAGMFGDGISMCDLVGFA